MKNTMKKMVGALAMVAFGSFANAATLSVVPSAASINAGSVFFVAINIADLIDSGAPSLGAFDFDINFDANVLSYAGFSWGDSVHGDQLDLAQLGSWSGYDDSNAATGLLNFYEVSLDESSELNNTQVGNFGLLTLNFSALNAGVSTLSLSVNALSDADGNNLANTLVNNGSVTVNAVPIPATFPLFASALLLMVGRRRNRAA